MTRRLPLVLALCAATALTGCGGGSSKDRSTPTPKALTEAQGKSLAAAGVLTEADLPGYTAAAQTHDASDDTDDAKIAACLGVPAQTYVARDFGKAFTKGAAEIDSSVDIASTAAAAKEQLKALIGPKAQDCLRAAITASVGAGDTITSFAATPSTPEVPGSDAAFAYTLKMTGTTGGQSFTFSGYEVGSLVGQAEVDVSVFAQGEAPPITLDETVALLKTATERTKAAS